MLTALMSMDPESIRLHSHSERARSIDVRDDIASSLDVTDFVAVLLSDL